MNAMRTTAVSGRGVLVLAAALAAATGPAVAPAAAGDETNLVPNGGMEDASAGDANRPAAWTPTVSGRTAAAWSTDQPHAGRRCLELSTDPNEKSGHAFWTSDEFAVKPCMAYRVRFCHRGRKYGTPIFQLKGVKEWRLPAGDAEGKWIAHEDVVVVPPDLTKTCFLAHNYHRPGKTMWLDDVSVLELPLAESPLTKRLDAAGRNVAAVRRNTASLRLTDEQQGELEQMRKGLDAARTSYAKLEAGAAEAADFKQMSDGLDAVEKAVGGFLFAVYALDAEPRPGQVPRPGAVGRQAEVALPAARGGTGRRWLGLVCLIDEGLAVRIAAEPDRAMRDWRVRLLTAPAHAGGDAGGAAPAWGELNSLGTLFLPPGVPRAVCAEIAPAQAKPGSYSLRLAVEGLDRPAEPGCAEVRVQVSDK